MEDNSHLGSCCRSHRFSPCVLWTSFCSWFVHVLERFFGWFGEGIAKHPLLTIPLCLVFVSICSVGFAWMKVENRTEKLFIPQNSKSMQDLNTAEKYFPVRFREEIVLLVASLDPPDIINRVCLEEALEVHQAVVELKSYSELCLTLSGAGAKNPKECMMINPLEIFQFDKGNLNRTDSQLKEKVSNEYMNTMSPQGLFVMRNGRSFRYNFERMFGKVGKEGENITGAQALQMIYYMRDPSDEDSNVKILEWEKTFVDKLQSLLSERSCFAVHFSSERSLDDAIAESSGSDVTLVSITFTLMISFACVMLGKFMNPLTGHSLLANAGVFAVALGILAGFGLAMWCRVPFLSMVGVLPFLILGIGIDDMFILVDELDRQQRSMTVVETVKEVLSRSGATITMTTLTDLVAFAVSTSTSFPAIRYFCVYAALTVTFSYLMIVTFFVAIMSYDVKRIKAGRRDCLPFCRAPPPKETAPAWDEPRLQTSNKLMEAWARFLTFSVVKVSVIIFSWCFLAAGIYGVTKVDESFDRRILAKDDSYLKKFLSTQEEYFELSIPVSVVETGNIDYGKRSVQEELRNLSKIVTSNKYYENRTLSWIEVFSQYALRRNKNILGSNFTPELLSFLNIYSNFKQDVKFSLDNKRVEVSRIMGFMKTSTSSSFQKNAMLTLREDLQTGTLKTLAAFPIARPFIFFEQYAITTRETVRNLLIAALAVLIVTSPFLVDCTVTFLVVLNFAALICELFGLMVIWGVSLNSVSMINLVMAIGFAVDYSAHIAHAYVMSDKDTANERVVEALSTLGASVFMGGFSTFLGMVVLAFAASEIFRIFFKMFLGIVLFGLLHGLCILPVYLSLFCRKPAITKPISAVHVSDECHSENDGVANRLQHNGKGGTEKVSTDGDLRSASSNEGFELQERQRPLNESTDDYCRSKDDATDFMMNEQHGSEEGAIKSTTEGDLKSASSNEGFEPNDQSRPLDRTVGVKQAHQENNESYVHNEVHDMEKEDVAVESNDPREVPQTSNSEESERELFLTTHTSEHGQEESGSINSKRYTKDDTPLTLNEQNTVSDDSTKF